MLLAGPGDFLELIEIERDGVAGVEGLASSTGLVVSPDSRHVYVAATGDDAISVFESHEVSGALRYLSVQVDNVGVVDGLDAVISLALSPDGLYLYAAAFLDNAVSVFARDPATGNLDFRQALFDGVDGVDALEGANWVAVSPDGRHVYVAGLLDDAVSVFSRHPTSGLLSLVEVQRDGGAQADATDVVDGLDGAATVNVSNDGRHIYVAGVQDSAIASFSRDPLSGRLQYLGQVQDGVDGVTGIVGLNTTALSPDGRNVYAVSPVDDSLVVFERHPADGKLTFLELHQDGQGGVDGLDEATQVSVHPNGRLVFVTTLNKPTIALFSRDPGTGELSFMAAESLGGSLDSPFRVAARPDGFGVYASTENSITAMATPLLSFVELHRDGINNVDGLADPNELLVSPDGKHLYVTGHIDDSVSVFERDPENGRVAYVQTYAEGVDGIVGLDGAYSLAMPANGQHLYVTALEADSMAVFARDPVSGLLSQLQHVQNGVDGVMGLEGPAYVRLSRDGRHVYVTANGSAAVLVFSRDLISGALSFLEVYFGVGLDGAQELAISPDDRHLYVAGSVNNLIQAFTRDPAAGTLGVPQALNLVISGTGVKGLALSRDGQWVFATQRGGRLSACSRDPMNGTIVVEEELDLMSWSVTSDPYDRYLYVTSSSLDQVVVLAQGPDGALFTLDFHGEGAGGVSGITGARSLALSPGGEHLYVSGGTGNSIAVFRSERLPTLFRDDFESGDLSRW